MTVTELINALQKYDDGCLVEVLLPHTLCDFKIKLLHPTDKAHPSVIQLIADELEYAFCPLCGEKCLRYDHEHDFDSIVEYGECTDCLGRCPSCEKIKLLHK